MKRKGGKIMTVKQFRKKWALIVLPIALLIIIGGLVLSFVKGNFEYFKYFSGFAFFGVVSSLFLALFLYKEKDIDTPETYVHLTNLIKNEEEKTQPNYNKEKMNPVETKLPEKSETVITVSSAEEAVFEEMTVSQLRECAKANKIIGYSTLKKSELIKRLRNE